MDDNSRAQFLLQREKLTKTTQDITNSLRVIGAQICEFGQRLQQDPSYVVFGGAPNGLGIIPVELINTPSFEWRRLTQALNLETTAKLVQDLRRTKEELQEVERQLKQPY